MSKQGTKGFQWKYMVWGIVALQCMVSIVLGWRLVSMGLLFGDYLVLYALGGLALDGITFLLARRKIISFFLCILCVVISCVMGYGLYALSHVYGTVKEITQNADIVETEIAIMVLEESEAKEITDLHQFHIGYLTEEKTASVSDVCEEINGHVGGEVTYREFEDVYDVVDALYDDAVSAIILDTAFVSMIEEMDGYTDFSLVTKIIHSFQVIDYIKLVKEEAEPVTAVGEETGKDTTAEETIVKRDKSKQFVAYISGIDTTGNVNRKSRSDVNILAVVNTETKQVQLINTPRDYFVELPNSGGVKDKLTHAGIYGIENSIGALEMLYDVEVDYYVRLNFSGFKEIIDAVGGVDVYSEYAFTVSYGPPSAPVKHVFVQGMNHLDGENALVFARTRSQFTSGDVQRGKNQMALITGMINKIASSEILNSYTDVLKAIGDSFQTNMSSEEIYALVKMQLEDMKPWEIASYTVTGTGDSSTTFSSPSRKSYVMIPDEETVKTARELMQEILFTEN